MRSEALVPCGRRDRARGLLRRAAAAGVVATVVGGGLWAGPAAADPTNPGVFTPTTSPGEAQARAQAAQLTQQIQAQGQRLDQLAEAYNGAQIHLTALTGQVHTAQQAVAATGRRVTSATLQVRNQAVAAYIGQPQPSLAGLAIDPNEGTAVAATYIESIGDLEKHAIDNLKQLRHTQTVQLASLHRQQKQAQHALSTLQADRQKAEQAQAAQEALLGHVQGQLAVYVAADQRQQQQAAQAAYLAQQATTTTTAAPAAPATTATTAAPNTAAVADVPRTTQPYVAPTTAYVPPQTAAPTTRYVAPTTAYVPPPTAPPTAPPTTAPPAPAAPAGPPPGASAAIAFAEAQIGKPYQWAGAGPNSWDCSGLVMVAWEQGGVYFPHLAQSQYDDTIRIPISALQPGDLVFFNDGGTIGHDGIYIGGGQMVDAPSTGHDVRIESIYWTNLAGAGRVR